MMDIHDRPLTSEPIEPYAVVRTLLAAVRMHRKRADRFVRETGLHPTQHRVLMYLLRRNVPCPQRELSDHFELTPAAVVQILDKLENEGYVMRETSTADSRRKEVSLTPFGKATAEKSAASFRELDRSVLRGISDEELRVFTYVLERIQENAQNSP